MAAEKKDDAQAAGIEDISNKHQNLNVQVDNQLEHDLTLKLVFNRHPALVWWCFYWAMAAVGW